MTYGKSQPKNRIEVSNVGYTFPWLSKLFLLIIKIHLYYRQKIQFFIKAI